jgi:hypothetical protein
MADDPGAGASYLAALKKSAASAGTPTIRSALPVLPEPAEKRRSPRYRCQGSAHLREFRSGVATWATFTDISLHGIYVEAMSTFAEGARLALTLETSGFRVESRGEVRVVYPGLGMGISFTAMSEEDRERLRQLLRSLTPPSVILTPRPDRDAAAIPAAIAPSLHDAAPALQAIFTFFEQRHILSRDEFLRILKKTQTSELQR